MQFKRIIVEAGEITTTTDLDAKEFDLSSLLKAGETLTLLRKSREDASTPNTPFLAKAVEALIKPKEGTSVGAVPVPNIQGMTLSLGTPDIIGSTHYLFYLTEPERPRLVCHVLSEESKEQSWSLSGAVAGSYLVAHPNGTPEDRDDGLIERTVEKIWKQCPCVVCFGQPEDSLSKFIDCFAAAMLLNPEPTSK